MSISKSKHQSLINGLSAIAKKVYGAVPIQDPWPTASVMSELSRSGARYEKKVVEGCLANLVNSGLIVEPASGTFLRVAIREKEDRPVVAPMKKDSAKKSPMEVLLDLADEARSFAEKLENAALEIEKEFQLSEAKSEKLTALQNLLKGMVD